MDLPIGDNAEYGTAFAALVIAVLVLVTNFRYQQGKQANVSGMRPSLLAVVKASFRELGTAAPFVGVLVLTLTALVIGSDATLRFATQHVAGPLDCTIEGDTYHSLDHSAFYLDANTSCGIFRVAASSTGLTTGREYELMYVSSSGFLTTTRDLLTARALD